MRKPSAVLISDIHYNLNTLELADAALTQAIQTANKLDVALIIAGDAHDTKANLRGECVSAIMNTLKQCRKMPFVIIGNHDLINEKSSENSLEFLQSLAVLVKRPLELETPAVHLIPYHSDLSALRAYLSEITPGSTLIMHQGVQGSDAGHYMQDPTALRHVDVARFNVISGHYHRRQTIKTGMGRTFSYIGNPFTLNFGETKDPEKGFQVLYDDGSLEFIPTNLRRHVVIELDQTLEKPDLSIKPDDLVLVKVKGSKPWLHSLNRQIIENVLGISNFRLDFITTGATIDVGEITTNKSQEEVLDGLIETLPLEVAKASLKALWRSLREIDQGTS